MKPVIVIVGRPNVGKSTLFNRLTGTRVAIVEERPGITRDRLYKNVEWNGRTFTLVDTGGLEYQEDGISKQVRHQVEQAINEADAILFMVDVRAGITPTDEEIAHILRRVNKPVLLVANKAEKLNDDYYEFFRLGLGEPIPVSAAQGLNTGDLLDNILQVLPDRENEEEEAIKIAVVGRPNVGKSSLVNRILGMERVIVSDMPGTTRDAVDTFFKRDGHSFLLIDTAGIRRKSKITRPTERYSIIRALRAIDRCNISLVMLEATQGVTGQDKRIAGYVHEKGKGCILVVNKWDLIKKDERIVNRYKEAIYHELAFVNYAPVIFVSALTGKGINHLPGLVERVWEGYNLKINTSLLNELLTEAQIRYPPPAHKARRLKIFYVVQKGIRPPAFVLFVNEPELMHFSYLRYLENKVRQAFGFEGTPIRLILRKR